MSTISIVWAACVSDCLTADSDLCVYVYDIMDDTSAMWDNWSIGSWHTKLLFDSCFTRLILTLKQAPRMHHCQAKKSKKKYGEVAQPPPHTPSPLGREIPPSQTPTSSAPRFSHLRRSRSFSFTTRNTDQDAYDWQTIVVTSKVKGQDYKLTSSVRLISASS